MDIFLAWEKWNHLCVSSFSEALLFFLFLKHLLEINNHTFAQILDSNAYKQLSLNNGKTEKFSYLLQLSSKKKLVIYCTRLLKVINLFFLSMQFFFRTLRFILEIDIHRIGFFFYYLRIGFSTILIMVLWRKTIVFLVYILAFLSASFLILQIRWGFGWLPRWLEYICTELMGANFLCRFASIFPTPWPHRPSCLLVSQHNRNRDRCKSDVSAQERRQCALYACFAEEKSLKNAMNILPPPMSASQRFWGAQSFPLL